MNPQRSALVVALAALVISACTSSTSITTPDQVGTDTSVATSAPATGPSQTTAVAPTSTVPELGDTSSTSTSEATPETFAYAVVAEERGRRLAVLDLTDPCMSEENPCQLSALLSIDLPASPHNLTAHGSVVFATHPRSGSISRIDIATGEVMTAAVGVEPHDVKFSTVDALLYVTDEEGRRLLTLDPETLDIVGVKDLPARPHDLAIAGDAIWITLIGTDELGRVVGEKLELFPTGKRPHDLIVDAAGLVWFSNWGSASVIATRRRTITNPSSSTARTGRWCTIWVERLRRRGTW